MTHPLRFWVKSRTLIGDAPNLFEGRVGARHQCPLESVGSCLCHLMLTCAYYDDSSIFFRYNLLLLTREEAAAHDAATAITGSVHPLLQAAGCDVVGTGSAAVVATGGKHDATLEVLLSAQAKLAEEEAIWVL